MREREREERREIQLIIAFILKIIDKMSLLPSFFLSFLRTIVTVVHTQVTPPPPFLICECDVVCFLFVSGYPKRVASLLSSLVTSCRHCATNKKKIVSFLSSSFVRFIFALSSSSHLCVCVCVWKEKKLLLLLHLSFLRKNK